MSEPQQETSQDGTMVRIGQAIMLHRGGDREEARNRFARLWEESTGKGDLFHRCTIAHYMADTQDDPTDELLWDQRALEAADALSGEEVHWGEHALAVRSLYPSLYLNLAADHAKLGDESAALRELGRARSAAGSLPDDAYGAGIRSGIEELGVRLGGSGGRA
ncbi:hypothetical protein [Streptomyces sp. ODS28]|uniref:hypothetical protein n=1 Tax=Streptomyces sp. ODS28 TaxID=3136688 RepID=UPI0031E8A040